MVDLLELAVAQGLLVDEGLDVVGGARHLDVEDGSLEAGGRCAERGQHHGGLEGLRGDGELDGEVGLFLYVCVCVGGLLLEYTRYTLIGSFFFFSPGRASKTYDLDDGLSIVLDREREGGLEAARGFTQDQEGLVRSLGLAVLLGRQEDLQWLGAAEGDGLGGGRRLAESIWLWAKEEKLLAIFCNSLIFGRKDIVAKNSSD